MAEADAPLHHGSHQGLLTASVTKGPVGAGIDAIIVPTIRSPGNLDDAADLARSLKRPLVTLHSGGRTSAAQAVGHLPADLSLIAIDVPGPERLRLPAFKTSRRLKRTIFERRSDISAKRNLALALSHMLGWSRILFLDDDITVLSADDVRRASSLLHNYDAVGFQVGGFPDNSVVCHAYRQSGGKQQSFVGAGSLVIDVKRCSSFFPDIYNDDWFFLIDDDQRLRPTAITGQVLQYPYDPFMSPDRALSEELGDVLAEGLFWLLDQAGTIGGADRQHWTRFLARRRRFIETVVEMVRGDDDLDDVEMEKRVAALSASLGCLDRISPAFCERYLRDWSSDRLTWRRYLAELPTGLDVSQAISELSRRNRFGRRQAFEWHVRPPVSSSPHPRPARGNVLF